MLQNRFDERGWRTIINLMAQVTYHGWAGATRRPTLTIEYYKDELAEYLTKARGPESAPLTFKLQPRPTGDAARHVVTEYDIPIAELENQRAYLDGSEWSAGIPSGMHGGGGMHDSVVDDNGNAWITDSVTNNFRTLAKVDPRTRAGHGIQADGARWEDARVVPMASPRIRTASCGSTHRAA